MTLSLLLHRILLFSTLRSTTRGFYILCMTRKIATFVFFCLEKQWYQQYWLRSPLFPHRNLKFSSISPANFSHIVLFGKLIYFIDLESIITLPKPHFNNDYSFMSLLCGREKSSFIFSVWNSYFRTFILPYEF